MDSMRFHLSISELCCIFILLLLGCSAGCVSEEQGKLSGTLGQRGIGTDGGSVTEEEKMSETPSQDGLDTDGGSVFEEQKKVNEVSALFESACERIEALDIEDFETVYVGSIRAEMAAAEVDLTEALKILDSISYDHLSLEEREGMDAVKVMCQVYIDICETMASDFCDFIDHYQKISPATDYEVAVDHCYEAEEALMRMKEKTTAMREKMDAVDLGHLPPEIKGDYVGLKTYVQEIEGTLEESVAMMDQAMNEAGL